MPGTLLESSQPEGQNTNQDEKENKKVPWYSRVLSFLKHRTVWRLIALATAALATVFSGGAAIPVAMLVATFLGSMIGVLGKTFQVKNLEKYRLQHSFLNIIKAKHDQLKALRANHQNVFSALEKLKNKPLESKIHQVKVSQPSERKAFLRTLRDVGLENILSFITFGSVANFTGFATYIFGVGSAIKNIKEEFDVRVQHDLEISQKKVGINNLCDEMQIPAYKNTRELSSIFRQEMIEYEATKKLCDEVSRAERMSEKEIQERYLEIKEEIAKSIKPNLPEEVPFGKKLWDAVRPWNLQPVDTFETINESTAYSIIPNAHTHKQKHHDGVKPPDTVPFQERVTERPRSSSYTRD